MKILDKLKVLFNKYNLTYFAEVGTALGAYRHGGFVPWDDDIDIAMLRKDFMILMEHAGEIDDDLCIRSVYNSETFMNFHAVCTHKVDILEWDDDRMRDYYGCPFICYVDIYPLDYYPRDPEKMQIFRELYYFSFKQVYDLLDIESSFNKGNLLSLGELRAMKQGKDNPEAESASVTLKELELLKSYIKNYMGENIRFKEDKPLRNQLCLCVEKVAQMCAEKDSDFIDYCPKIPISKKLRPRNKGWYADVKEVPFECTTIKVPVECAKALEAHYGPNYMVPIRGKAGHDYPYFRDEVTVLVGGDTGDNYVGISEEEAEIPQEWIEVLFRGDGTKRKITLYGLSATDVLNRGGPGINMVKNYVEEIENSPEDVLLIMLAPAGLKDFMERCRLELSGDYTRMIQDFSSMEKVIFDDNPDSREMAMAMSVADEYYGDKCRLADLCQEIGIPVTILGY
ncbi:LicD family protein [Butyrivibrio sp. AE2032]|uniref:LicD family protein n=1 Tax=Butyrivibrio sp. AE2032 TaxID=1458463 RepID=UPI000AB98C4A|nr:LicD family protein [Butyrivibrio sp. AE2032]